MINRRMRELILNRVWSKDKEERGFKILQEKYIEQDAFVL